MAEAATTTLSDIVSERAAERGSKPAFVFEGRSTSFEAFDRRTNQVAQALLAAGIEKCDRIAFIGKNSDSYFELLIGAAKMGAVTVPVNWRLAPPEVAAILADAHAKLVLVGPGFVEATAAISSILPSDILFVSAEGTHEPWAFWEEWVAVQPFSPPAHTAAPGDVALQLYTSGTTGRPKGVMLTHANFTSYYEADLANDLGWNRWEESDSSLLAMPVSHISGSGWGLVSFSRGATCHIHRQFDLDETFDTLEQYRVSKVFLVPAALQMLVRHPRAAAADFSCIRHMAYGASPMPVALLRECIDVLKTGFVQMYGMTETTGTIVAMPPEDHLDPASPRLRAAGRALPWVEIKVVGLDGEALPPGRVGEIVTRSSLNMAGYWQLPDQTARTLRNGWVHTGDAGYLDEDGYLFIHDRLKDMIISGGENIYPAEVESALSEHPAIAEVAVIGVPDERWGEAVKAVVVLRPDAQVSAEALIGWARERIAGFKAPQSIDFADSLPRNSAGKLLKRELRERYWEGMDRQVN